MSCRIPNLHPDMKLALSANKSVNKSVLLLTLFDSESGHRQCVREPASPGPGQVGITLAIEQVFIFMFTILMVNFII